MRPVMFTLHRYSHISYAAAMHNDARVRSRRGYWPLRARNVSGYAGPITFAYAYVNRVPSPYRGANIVVRKASHAAGNRSKAG